MAERIRFQPSEERSTSHHSWPSTVSLPLSSAPGPIERYLQAVRHEAHCSLDAGTAEAIVAEVTSHVIDRADALTGDGVTREVAEKEAVAGFADARSLVHQLTEPALQNRWSRIAKRVSILAPVVFFIALFWVLTHGGYMATSQPWFGWLGVVSGLLVAIGSFIGRSFRVRLFALFAATFVLLPTLINGFTTIDRSWLNPGNRPAIGFDPVYRNDIPALRTIYRNNRAIALEEIEILKKGIEFYENNGPFMMRLPHEKIPIQKLGRIVDGRKEFADVPQGLQTGADFIIPFHDDELKNKLRISAFRQQTSVPKITGETWLENQAREVAALRQQPMQTMSQAGAAVYYWRLVGRKWLEHHNSMLTSADEVLKACDRADTIPYFWNQQAAWSTFKNPELWLAGVLLIVLHLVPAWGSRKLIRAYRQWIWRMQYAS